MKRFLYPVLGLIGLLGIGTWALAQGAGIGLVSEPQDNDVIVLETTSPTTVGITADALKTWMALSPFDTDMIIGDGVNQIGLTGGATTVAPKINPAGVGSDTNIGIVLSGKGTGNACLGGSTCANSSLQVATTASAVANVLVTGKTTGNAPTIAANGETNLSLALSGAGTGRVTLGSTTTCSGTTTATCNAQRFVVSITGLTTAAGGTESAAMVVTNTRVLSSSVNVICSVNGYAGGGVPIVTRIIPGTGSVSMTVTNVAASDALDATVPIACLVI